MYGVLYNYTSIEEELNKSKLEYEKLKHEMKITENIDEQFNKRLLLAYNKGRIDLTQAILDQCKWIYI